MNICVRTGKIVSIDEILRETKDKVRLYLGRLETPEIWSSKLLRSS